MTTILALGETHHGAHNKEIQKVLSENDFDAIFLELPNDFQEYTKQYIKTGVIPIRLESYIKGAEKEGNNIRDNFETLFRYARENNIPIICIDSSKTLQGEYQNKSTLGNWFLRGISRDEDMFNNILSYIKNHQGKLLLITGTNHLAEGKHLRSREETLGTKLSREFENNFSTQIL